MAALFLGASSIGFAPIFLRYSEVGPSATAMYRVLLAAPLFWTLLWRRQRRPSPPRQPATAHEFRLLIVTGVFFALDLSLWHWSITMTTVSNATLLANLAPLVVTAGAWLLLKEPVTRQFLLAMMVAFVGAFLLMGASARFARENLPGDALALFTALFYAAYQLWVKRLRLRFDPITILAWTGIPAVIGFLLIALLLNEKLVPDTAQGWATLLGLALVSQFLGQGSIAYAFGHLPASFTSLSLLWQPMVATAVAWILFGEFLRPIQFLGAATLMAGLLIANKDAVTRAAKRSQAPPGGSHKT